MQPIDAYAKSTHLRVILQGPPGSGKTTLACQFPGAYIIDIDRKLGGPLTVLQDKKMTLPVGFDYCDTDATGKLIPLLEKGKMPPAFSRYKRINQLLLEAQQNDAIQTIVLDSATNMANLLMEETLIMQGKTSFDEYKEPRQFWGFFAQYGKALMATITQMRKHVILICHEVTEKSASGSVVYPIKLNWPGQVGQILGAFFTDVWRCEPEQLPDPQKPMEKITKWFIRTSPNMQYSLINSRGWPTRFEWDWKIIEEKLK